MNTFVFGCAPAGSRAPLLERGGAHPREVLHVHYLFWYPIVSHYHPQRFSIDAVECFIISSRPIKSFLYFQRFLSNILMEFSMNVFKIKKNVDEIENVKKRKKTFFTSMSKTVADKANVTIND